jgi:flavin reductase (DIM6/NTAB) family NADH-FMN oxidoreductase RutF
VDERKERTLSSSNTEAMTTSANYPLYVVTTSLAGEHSGCLAGFVTQASLTPVRFVVCVSKVNHTFRIAEGSKSLALHLLGSDQQEMASLFGEFSGDVTDKFETVAWRRGVTGAPVLTECAAWVEGSIINQMSGGDHEAFLMTVVDGGDGPHRGTFRQHDADDFEAGHPA